MAEITTKLQEVVNVSEFMLSGLVEFSVCEMAARLELEAAGLRCSLVTSLTRGRGEEARPATSRNPGKGMHVSSVVFPPSLVHKMRCSLPLWG
jgi:hypothetical protein